MARAAKKETALTAEEKLAQALVPEAEQPYRVPANWCWVKLKSISSHISDGSHNPPKDSGEGIPLLSATNIHDRIIDFEQTARWITEDEWLLENERTKIEVGDILLTIVATIGRVAVVTTDRPFALQRSVATIKPKINAQYLSYYFESPYVQTFMNTNAKGTAQKGFYLNSLENLFCAVPPADEQERIVDRIESLFAKLDEAKEKAQAVVDGYDARRAAILHKAFTGELTSKWRSVRGVKKDSWLNTNLSHSVLSFKYGTSEKSTYENTGMPVFRIPNVTDLGLSFEDLKYLPHDDIPYENQIHENEVLIIRSNGSRDLVGKSVLVPHLDRQYAYASFLIKAVPAKMIDPAFLVYYLNSADARNQMFRKAKSTAGINNINSKELSEITISVPPLQEQAEIVSILGKLLEGEMQAVETAKNAVEKIEQMKKSILSRTFRGELGTNDPNDESAVELLKRVL